MVPVARGDGRRRAGIVRPLAREALSDAEARFDAIRRRVGLISGPLALVVMLATPMPSLSEPAHRLAAVATMAVILWVTEAIPLAVTALLAPALAVILGVTNAKAALAPFADPLIFLFMGGFFLAKGLSAQGFDRRAALWLMARKIVAGSPRRAVVAIGAIAFGFSMWISNTATTAMLIPVALGLRATMAKVVGDDPEARRRLDHYAGGMCLTLAYAANLGGVSTPIGTGPNVIALGVLDNVGVRFDFFQWMSFALPTALVGVTFVLYRNLRTFPPPAERIEGLTEEVKRELSALGPMGTGERRAVAIFGLAVAGWLIPSIFKLTLGPADPITQWAREGLREGIVAIAAASFLFVVPNGRDGWPILEWREAERIDWGTLFLLGGGIALGKMVFDTGLAQAIGEAVKSFPLANHPLGLLVAACTLVIYLTEVTSNSATTSMMLPVLIGIAQALGTDPVPVAVAVTMAASFAFMLPVSTPPNAMAYGTGMLRIGDMIRVGFWLDLVGLIIVVAAGALLVPMMT